MMEEKKRLEEEARRREEEERKRIEEEERRAEEEAQRKEEEKQRKKEKEKVCRHCPHCAPLSYLLLQAKREVARKEGRLLTKKQKEEQRAAEIRRQALLSSGVQIEGLHQPGAPAKRPVYGNRKKGGSAKGGSPAPDSVPQTPEPPRPKELAPEPIPEPEPAPSAMEKVAEDVPDDWEASSEEEKGPPAAEVKETWDDSSEEEGPPPVATPVPKPTPAPRGAAKTVPTKGLLFVIYCIFARLICTQRTVPLQSPKLQRQPLLPPPAGLRRPKPSLPLNPVPRSLRRRMTRKRILKRRVTLILTIQKMLELLRNGWLLSARSRLLRGVRRHAKMPLRREVKMTFVALFVAFWDMWTRGRPNFWTKYALPTLARHGADGLRAVDSPNECPGGGGWRYHATNRCNLLPGRGYQNEDRRSE
jgi:hypothetical protein